MLRILLLSVFAFMVTVSVVNSAITFCTKGEDEIILKCQAIVGNSTLDGSNQDKMCKILRNYLSCMQNVNVSDTCKDDPKVLTTINTITTLGFKYHCIANYGQCTTNDEVIIGKCKVKLGTMTAASTNTTSICKIFDEFLLCLGTVNESCKQDPTFKSLNRQAAVQVQKIGCLGCTKIDKQSLQNCSTTFKANVETNQTAVLCNAVDKYIFCIDEVALTCQYSPAIQDILSSMTSLVQKYHCLPSPRGKCSSADVATMMRCKVHLQTGLNTAHDESAGCTILDAFLTCVSGVSAKCQTDDTYKNAYVKVEAKVQKQGCLACSDSDGILLLQCQHTYAASISKAGNNHTQACKALDEYIVCTHEVSLPCEESPERKGPMTRLVLQAEGLGCISNSSGKCSVSDTIQIASCNVKLTNAMAASTGETLECSVLDRSLACVNDVSASCKTDTSYKTTIKKATAMVQKQKCTGKSGSAVLSWSVTTGVGLVLVLIHSIT